LRKASQKGEHVFACALKAVASGHPLGEGRDERLAVDLGFEAALDPSENLVDVKGLAGGGEYVMSHINLGHTFFGDPAASAPKELTGRRGSQLSNGLELSVKGTFDDFENGVAHGGDIFHSRRKSRERYVCQYKIPTHISKWPNPRPGATPQEY